MSSRLSIFYGRIRVTEQHPGQETFMPRDPLWEAVEKSTSVERYRYEWCSAIWDFDDGGGD